MTFQMADRDQLHKVLVAGFILDEQNQVINRLIFTTASLTARARG